MHIWAAEARKCSVRKDAKKKETFCTISGFTRGRVVHVELSPDQKTEGPSYFLIPDQSVINPDWPFFTMVGYTLSNPLWSDEL